jgi:hypothetical protein
MSGKKETEKGIDLSQSRSNDSIYEANRIFICWNSLSGSQTEGTLVLSVKWHGSFSIFH